MELYIDYDKIREIHSYIQEKTAGWMDNLAEIIQIISEMSVDAAMEGESAEKILSYMTEVHGSMYVLISDIISDFLTRQMMFETELYELDKDAYAIIPEDYVNNTISKYSETYDLFDEYVENLNKILYNIGDVIEPVEPNSENIYTELEEYITREKQKMQQYHELDERFCFNEFSDFEQRIDALTEYISNIRENYSDRKTYSQGSIQQLPYYQICIENYLKHMEYQLENESEIQSATELYIDVNTKVAADKRAQAGWQKAFRGASLLLLGGTALGVAFGGVALTATAATTAEVATTVSASTLWYTAIGCSGASTTLFGLSDSYEGVQDVKFGLNGDIYSEAKNPLKKFLGEEDYYRIEQASANITSGLLTVDMIYNIGKGRLWGKSEAEANVEPTKIENTETARIEATETKIAELNDAKIAEFNEIEQVVGNETAEIEVGEVIEGGSEFASSKIYYDKQGNLTNGSYTINDSDMLPHKNGTLGKSQFLSDVDAEKAVLDAAEYADKYNLWETNTGNPNDFACKAKVYVENGPVGITGDGKLTNYINVYRTKTGQVHGCPGN